MALKGEGDEAPKIRIARPVTAMPFEGTRKRRRAAMVDYVWSVGDKVDAWIQDRYVSMHGYKRVVLTFDRKFQNTHTHTHIKPNMFDVEKMNNITKSKELM